MVVISHSCGYKAELSFNCPACGEPFCNEDQEQLGRCMVRGYMLNDKRINDLEIEVKALREKIESCKKCKW